MFCMAMRDWNNDGKKDMVDNYIEYQIYKDVTGQNDEPSYTPSRRDGISTFGAIISVLAGLFLQAVLYNGIGEISSLGISLNILIPSTT